MPDSVLASDTFYRPNILCYDPHWSDTVIGLHFQLKAKVKKNRFGFMLEHLIIVERLILLSTIESLHYMILTLQSGRAGDGIRIGRR